MNDTINTATWILANKDILVTAEEHRRIIGELLKMVPKPDPYGNKAIGGPMPPRRDANETRESHKWWKVWKSTN